MFKHIRLIVGIVVLIASALVLLWSVLPIKNVSLTQVLQPEAMSLKINRRQDMFAIPGPYQVMLEWPVGLRIGDQGVVSLTLQAMQRDDASSSQKLNYFDVYDAANIMAEARLELAGVVVKPAIPTRISLLPDKSVTFTWQIKPVQVGSYTGNTWLSLRFLPLDGSPAIQMPVYVGEIYLHATSLLGLSAQVTRLLGGMGIIIGFGLAISDMIKSKFPMNKQAVVPDVINSKGIS